MKRTIQRLEKSGWTDVCPEQVKEGDIIRMFETNGKPVIPKDWPKYSKYEMKVEKIVHIQGNHYRFIVVPF